MATTYLQAGDTISFTASADVSSGDTLGLTDIVGIALGDVANGAEGEARVSGVFSVVKKTGEVWTAGQKVNWDASGEHWTSGATSAAGDVTAGGVSITAVASGVLVGEVLLTPGAGTKGA